MSLVIWTNNEIFLCLKQLSQMSVPERYTIKLEIEMIYFVLLYQLDLFLVQFYIDKCFVSIFIPQMVF